MNAQKHHEQLSLAHRGYDLTNRSWIEIELSTEELERVNAICAERGILISEYIGDLVDRDLAHN